MGTDQLVLDINQEQHGNNPLNNVENISDGAKFVQLPECDSNKSEKNILPPQENISSSKQKSIIGDGNFLRRIAGGVPREEEDVMFCSPFRRRRKKTECYLTREEAWEMSLAKLEEEANYFSITDNNDPDT